MRDLSKHPCYDRLTGTLYHRAVVPEYCLRPCERCGTLVDQDRRQGIGKPLSWEPLQTEEARPDVKLFAWRSGAIAGYHSGTVAVVATSVEEARAKIAADVDRWLKFGADEGSPVWHNFDQETGKLWDEAWDDVDQADFDKRKADLLADISKDPVTLPESGILWRDGGA